MVYRNSVILYSLSCFLVLRCAAYSDPDLNRNFEELITSRGFKCEIHEITTTDGYILGYYRIVNPATISKPELRKRPVLLHHGLLSSGVDFIINSPGGDYDPSILDETFNGVDVDGQEKFIKHTVNSSQTKEVGNNLGFVLANLGYDVWLGNSRGTTYSKKHTHYDVKDKRFWKFSTDEMIKYDIPAGIDYILHATGRESLAYVGHSQVAQFVEIKGLFHLIAKIPGILEFGKHMKGQLLPRSSIIETIGKTVCVSPLKFVCTDLIFLVCGFDRLQMNVTREPVYTAHDPSGTSWRNVYHYGQMVKAKKWQMFDYGFFENELHYGTPHPPEYPLAAIRSNYIALIYGENDLIATPKNVASIKSHLTVPLLDDYLVPYSKWNHIDFLWGLEAGKHVYARTIQNIKLFDSHK
ncbi:gastric triacylglycerol lipase-like isoform X2 [Brevipalpus obovatus]|uniref:gastric triacylglycerol lipase-like isoform X2 n=1 Tax=Brevipalpus obovatus TaxID=246614 RepID=UPI003D9E8B44